MSGVTAQGFVSKTVTEVKSDTEAAVRRVYGSGANVDARSRVGQFIGILSDALSSVWGLAEAVAGALDPNSATGVLLDNLSALTLTTRQAASASTVTLACIGTNGTVLAIGKQAGVIGSDTVFATTAAGTITTASAWAVGAHTQGDVVTSSGALWRAQNAGTSGATAPSGTADFIDGGVAWEYLGAGTAFVELPATATATGPRQAFAKSVTTILSPTSGWSAVTNALDGIPGRNRELDSELRVRRAAGVAAIGTSPLPQIRAAVLAVKDVTTCTVFENATDNTVDSLPPHSFEVLVEGGSTAALALKILTSKPAGIASYGTTTASATTSDGVSRSVKFSRPTSVDIWVDVSLVKDAAKYPIDGDAKVKDAIASIGDAQLLGRDVVASAVSAIIFANVPGVLDVSYVHIGTAASPTLSTTVPMSLRQRANYDSSRVTVISVDGVP